MLPERLEHMASLVTGGTEHFADMNPGQKSNIIKLVLMDALHEELRGIHETLERLVNKR